MNKSVLMPIFLSFFTVFLSGAVAEQRGCDDDEMIPHFMNHIKDHGDKQECEEVGRFPKPGDCTVFFNCVRGRGKISRILEYCSKGYVFDGRSCIPVDDKYNCPQLQMNCTTVGGSSSSDSLKRGISSHSSPVPLEVTISAAQQASESPNNNAGECRYPQTMMIVIMLAIYLMFDGY